MRRRSAHSNAQISTLILLLSAQAAIAQVMSVSQLSCTPTSLTSDSTAACTVTLTGAAPLGGTGVSLSSSNTLLPLPGNSITVPQGSTSANFAVTAGTIPGNQTVTLTATAQNSVLLTWDNSSSSGITNYRVYRGVTNGGPYSVLATVGLVTAYTDYNIQNGDTYYYVTTALNSSGTESAQSDQASAAVPAGVPQTATLNLQAPLLSSLTCNAATLLSLGVTTCTVTLGSSAPAGGTTVSIGSNSILLSVAVSSVTVPAGSSSTTFTATAGQITGNQTATLTATLNGASQIATLNLVAPAMLNSLACSPASLTSGSSTTCIVTLSNPAPTGTTLAVSSDSGLLSVPLTSITVPAGSESAAFTAMAGTITSNQTATLNATLNGVSQTATINLLAPAGPGIASVSCIKPSLESYTLTFCTLKLTAPVNVAGGITVSLSTNTSLLGIPSVAAIPEGLDIAVFPAFAGSVSQSQTATITASVNSSTASVSLTLTP